MKKILLSLYLLGINEFAFTQATAPVGNGWTAAKYLGFDASNGVNPLFTKTNNITRTRLNGNQTTTINGVNQNVSGYFGIGPNGWFNTNSPWAMLHLDGQNVSGNAGNGWRSWMQTGVLMREESDIMYVGLQRFGNNRADAVVSWSDDAGNVDGVDKLRFLFTGNSSSGNGEGTNNMNGASLNGYEFMRMQNVDLQFNELAYRVGFIGIGPLFTDLLTPQNRLHMNAESGLANFLQISNVVGGGRPGTGQLETDGLKIGAQSTNSTQGARQTGYLQWQENTPFIVQTDWDGNAGGINNGERIRVTSIGALNNTEGNFGGLTTPVNVTRIGISYFGSVPLTQPRSLLHLGLNDGIAWRNWMDLGTFTASNIGHTYVGSSGNTADQVIAWGANQNNNLTYVFTRNQTAGLESQTLGGLEGMRMTPTDNDGVLTGIGGDPQANQYGPAGNSANPTATLEVNSWGATNLAGGSSGLRFTNLNTSSPTIANPGQGVLSVDADGDVIYVQNTSVNGFGSICSDNVNNIFTVDRKVNLNNNSFYFEGNGINNNENNVGFGWACGTPLKAKIDVYSDGTGGLGGSFFTTENWINGVNSLTPTGAVGIAIGNGNTSAGYYGIRGEAYGVNYSGNYGVYGVAPATINSYAGYFNGDVQAGATYITSDSTLKNNVFPIKGALNTINKLAPKSYYMDTLNNPSFEFSNQLQYGFIAQEIQAVLPSIVKTSTLQGEFDQNGDFVEDRTTYLSLNYNAIIPINTQAIIELNQKVDKATLSDQSIKTNVQDLSGSLDKVLNMHGVSYDWNHTVHPELNLDSANHVGFIAQEMAQIDARLTYLADDSLLHIEYDKVVPILAEAIQELNDSIGSRDSIISVLVNQNAAQQTTINDLNNRLTNLENCLSALLPSLCQMNQSLIQNNTPAQQEEVRAQLSVRLANKEAIILDQNVPNPFAEQTVINFSIPATVQKAQIHFYDSNGKIIQSVDVVERGLGSLTVFGADLSTGIYTYTLVADGQIVATKRMMKE